MKVIINKIYQQLDMRSNYSPYNRTYKYICLQNQMAHIKNRNTVKSLGKSNISISVSPEKMASIVGNKNVSYSSTKPFNDFFGTMDQSKVGNRQVSFTIIEPYRLIHKNQSYDKKRKRQQYLENERLARKLCNITCNIVTKEQSEKKFDEHLDYKQIRRRYNQGGQLKELLRLNSETSLTASNVKKMKNSGVQFCNVSDFCQQKFKKSKKSSSSLLKKPKSNIIRLY